jgi:hypothetical protein
MTRLRGVLAAAGEVQRFCQARRWAFCLIGGVAVQRWGEPRLTQDVDLTVLAGLGNESAFVDALLASFVARRDDAREFAFEHRVLLLRTARGVDVDVALGALPFEERTIRRASPWAWGGKTALITCSAEDLLVHKVFAGRDRDWGDVDGILARQYGRLDLTLVRQELAPLLDLKEEPEALAKLEHRIATIERRLRDA